VVQAVERQKIEGFKLRECRESMTYDEFWLGRRFEKKMEEKGGFEMV
jgi:hypothetical protein